MRTSKDLKHPLSIDQPAPPSVARQALALAGWLALCGAAGGTAAFIAVDGWYDGIQKPSWNPPAWLFGPVWTVLYGMMAVAVWLVWQRGGWKEQKAPLGIFAGQLALNAIWTPLFFGIHEIGWALADIVLLWIAILATLFAFWRVRRDAAALLVPYLAWVSFAAFLNFTLWKLNSQ